MHGSRIGVAALAATIAVVTVPAVAGASAGDNAPDVRGHVEASVAGPAAPAGVGSLKPINRPNARYVGKTCVFDLSGFDDFEGVTQLVGCGITVDFDVEMTKRTTGQSWGTWGSPPHTESATPLVLHRLNEPSTATITLSQKSSITGFEAEPQPFAVHDITATFLNGKGDVEGAVTRAIDGEAGARLLAAKAKGVRKIVITSDVLYAIAQLRVRV